jgi:hypothetical protein
VEGDPPSRVLWKKDGSTIPRNISYNTNSLIIDEAMFDDKGVYQCIAINRAGNATRQVRITVLGKAAGQHGCISSFNIEFLHDHVRAAMLDGRTIESLSPEKLNSFSCKYILLFLPSNMAAVT